MFVEFFLHLRARGIPATPTEFLALVEAMEKNHAQSNLSHFYALSRALLVKNEAHFDTFDQAFAEYFEGVEISKELPDELLDWLANPVIPDHLTPEQLAILEKLDLDELRRRFEETLQKQKERHDGGGRWIGTGGHSPFGHSGQHPTGVRVGGSGGRRSALQVASSRRFRNLRKDRVLDTRQIGMALRKLRMLKREGPQDELALGETIDATAKNGGEIELIFQAPRKNNVKLALMMDVGGSMDPFTALCERLFSAAHAANHFKQFRYYFFHNCIYGELYADMIRLRGEPTAEVLKKLDKTWALILVGDAYMHPFELSERGGALDYSYHNHKPGISWLRTVRDKVPNSVWLNPEPRRIWNASTILSIRQIFPMFELTLEGMEDAVDHLRGAKKKKALKRRAG